MKKRAMKLASLCLTAGILFSGVPVYADEAAGVQAESTADTDMVGQLVFAKCEEYINIREDANTDSEITAKIYNNGAATVIGQVGDWYEITSGNAKGYVKAEYFATGEEAAELANALAYNVATVYPEELNIRTGPGEDYGTKGVAYKKDELEVVDYSGDWMKVALGGDEYGYINAYYVSYTTYYPVAETLEEEQARLNAEYEALLAAQQAADTRDDSESVSSETWDDSADYDSEDMSTDASWDDSWEEDSWSDDSWESTDDGSWTETDNSNSDDTWTESDSSNDAWTEPEAEQPEDTWTDSNSSDDTWTETEAAQPEDTWTDSDSSDDTWTETEAAQPEDTWTDSDSSDDTWTETEAAQPEDTWTDSDNSDDTWTESDSSNESWTETEATQPEESWENTDDSSSDDTWTETEAAVSTGQSIADYAVQFVGNPYVWGGTSLTNGADCSGFVQSVFANFGIGLARTAADQSYGGTSVSLDSLQAGDLVFYGSSGIDHVALYIGGGQVVHAANSKSGIIISSCYYNTPVCARRYW